MGRRLHLHPAIVNLKSVLYARAHQLPSKRAMDVGGMECGSKSTGGDVEGGDEKIDGRVSEEGESQAWER